MFVPRGVLIIKCPVRVCNEMYCVANVSNQHAVVSNKQTRRIRNEQMKFQVQLNPDEATAINGHPHVGLMCVKLHDTNLHRRLKYQIRPQNFQFPIL